MGLRLHAMVIGDTRTVADADNQASQMYKESTGTHAKISRTLCSPATRESISSFVL